MKRVVVTYDPGRSFEARASKIYSSTKEIAYFRWIEALNRRGVPVDFFDDNDFNFLAHESPEAIKQYLIERFEHTAFIFHHVDEFNAAMLQFLHEKSQYEFAGMALSCINHGTTMPESTVNSLIYERFGNISHGVYVPRAYAAENIRRKDMLPSIANKIDVPTPRTVVPASKFEGQFYPAFLKRSISRCGRDVHIIPDEDTFEEYKEALNESLDDYVVQEAVKLPTEASSKFRVVCFRNKVLGIVLYYSEHPFISNRSETSFSVYIPNFPHDLTHAASGLDGAVADSYWEYDFIDIFSQLSHYAERIAKYCSERGCQRIGIDFVMDTEGNPYCLDINRDPGTGFYRIQFGEKERYRRIGSGIALAAEVSADILAEQLKG